MAKQAVKIGCRSYRGKTCKVYKRKILAGMFVLLHEYFQNLVFL